MRYADAAAFRMALEQRLKNTADGDGARLARDRKRIAFDRLLARLAATAPERWLLKGGHTDAAALLDPILGETVIVGTWNPDDRLWSLTSPATAHST